MTFPPPPPPPVRDTGPHAGDEAGLGASGPASSGGTPVDGSAPVPPPPSPESDHPWRRNLARIWHPRCWRWLENLSLTAKLVMILCALLAAALAVSAAATVAFSYHYLVEQVDQQLHQAANAPASVLNNTNGGSQLTEYYATVRVDGSAIVEQILPRSITQYGRPELPTLTPAQAQQMDGRYLTVGSTGGTNPSDWRVIVARVVTAGGQPATLMVALPLAGIHNTVRILKLTLALSAIGVILIGAVVAFFAVRRSLRPLRQIETTAAAIAAGDLSQRIPPTPPTTEVGSLSASLNAMLAQIEQAFAAREASEARMRQFVSDASHELRTPLATIRGWGELYRMGALDTDDKVEDTMSRIEDAATRMGTLVNDLLALARLDEGRPTRRDRVDLLPLVHDSVQDLHALDPTRDVTLIGLDGGRPPAGAFVIGDEERLRQVLVNLVGNIARHTPPGTPAQIAIGTVPSRGVQAGGIAGTATAHHGPPVAEDGRPATGTDPAGGRTDDDTATKEVPTGRDVVLEVRDHGPGIDGDQFDRIFERFYRADSSRTRASGGSGLGLAIVAAIVGAHGGTVSVATTEGGGLTVRVLLPETR